MSERLNKTSICSIVFLDIAEYSQQSVSEQIECKDNFNRLISDAIKDVAQSDRIILDTGDGAAIALLGAPEDALFISLTIRDGILKGNQERTNAHLFVRIGINLGPVRVVKDINSQLSIIGDGINVAQRVMSFAEPNQILVSRSYYEVVSRLNDEFTQMFTYFGIKQDKHVREHEVYMIRAAGDHATALEHDEAEGASFGSNIKFHKNPKKLAVMASLVALTLGSALMVWQHKQTAETVVQSRPLPALAATSVAVNAVTHTQAQAGDAPTQSVVKKARKSQDRNAAGSGTHKTGEHQSAEYRSGESGKLAKMDASTKPVQHVHENKQIKQDSATCTEVQRSLNQCH